MFIQAPQGAVMHEINGMSERVRAMRRIDAVGNSTQIKTVEGQLRTKWDELRLLRAGAFSPTDRPREGSHLNHVYHAFAFREGDR